MGKKKVLYFEIFNNGKTILEKSIPTSQKIDMVNDALIDAESSGIKAAIDIIVKHYEQNLQFVNIDNCCQKHTREHFLDIYKELHTLLTSSQLTKKSSQL